MGRRDLDAQDARHQAVHPRRRRAGRLTETSWSCSAAPSSARPSTKRGSGTARTGRYGRPPPVRPRFRQDGRRGQQAGDVRRRDAEPADGAGRHLGVGRHELDGLDAPRHRNQPGASLLSRDGGPGRQGRRVRRGRPLLLRRHVGMERQRMDVSHARASSAGALLHGVRAGRRERHAVGRLRLHLHSRERHLAVGRQRLDAAHARRRAGGASTPRRPRSTAGSSCSAATATTPFRRHLGVGRRDLDAAEGGDHAARFWCYGLRRGVGDVRTEGVAGHGLLRCPDHGDLGVRRRLDQARPRHEPAWAPVPRAGGRRQQGGDVRREGGRRRSRRHHPRRHLGVGRQRLDGQDAGRHAAPALGRHDGDAGRQGRAVRRLQQRIVERDVGVERRHLDAPHARHHSPRPAARRR